MREIDAGTVAARLRVTQRHAAQLLRSGVIEGRQLSSGLWLTTDAALERYESSVRSGRGRALNPATAWGLLWELSGLSADWLTASTRSRVRAQIASANADEIVRLVSGRTHVRHYRPAAVEVTTAGLIATGASVAGCLNVNLRDNPRVMAGYVRNGQFDAHAKRVNMTPDYQGEHTLFEYTLPIAYNEPRMPDAVVAADLARSARASHRLKGVAALEQMRRRWIEAR